MNRIMPLLLVVCLLTGCAIKKIANSPFSVSSGTVDYIENFPSKFIASRNVAIWLPDDYNKQEKYAVLYMHDGQMLFDASTTWNKQEWGVDEVVGKLIAEGAIKKCIVVGVWNSGPARHSDYFPQKPFESLPKQTRDSLLQLGKSMESPGLFAAGVQSDNYLKFLVKELKPYVDKKYATLPDRENTFVAGSSMGGLISWYAICEYPGIFGGAACMSTHWPGTFVAENNPIPGAFMDYLKTNLPNPATHQLYFDYGTETLDAMYEPFQWQADEIIKSKGYTAANWETMKFAGADHSEKSWNKRLAIPVTFLLKK